MPSALAVNWARFRVAVCLVAAAAILSVLVYLLTGGTLLEEKTALYLFLPDATGVESGTPVRVNGTNVGKVGTVALSGSNQPNRVVKLTLSVERAHLPDIPADSWAQISAEGATGEKYVDITQGRSRARIQSDGEIGYKAQPELLKTLDLQQFVQQLRVMDATLTEIEQGRTPVGELIVGTAMYEDMRKKLADADRGFREATSTSSRAGQLLLTDQAYRKASDRVVQLDDSLGRIQAGQGDLGRLLREDGQYVHFRDQAAALRQSIADLRAQKFLASDELYTSWNRELAALIQQVDGINTSTMFSNSAEYDNLAGFAREMRDTVREFRQDPKKFLRIKVF